MLGRLNTGPHTPPGGLQTPLIVVEVIVVVKITKVRQKEKLVLLSEELEKLLQTAKGNKEYAMYVPIYKCRIKIKGIRKPFYYFSVDSELIKEAE